MKGDHGLYKVVALCAFNSFGLVAASWAQSVDSTLWGVEPGATVYAVARAGNTLYVGGTFFTIGPNTGSGVPVDIPSGRAAPHFPRVAGGRVNAVVPDGGGGWFIGGAFSGVEGRPHANLAHLRSDGLDDAWTAGTDREVCALALSGSVLYVGGQLNSLDGARRIGLGAVDARTGALTGWDPEPNNAVFALLVEGSSVYAGGRFTAVGGLPRGYLAAIDTSTGLPTAWDPEANGDVQTLALHDSALFVGGYFGGVGGQARPYVAAVELGTGAVLPWNAHASRTPSFIYDGGPRVDALLVQDSTLYVAGSFKSIGGQYREGLAAVSVTTAQATAWDPRAYSAIVFGAYFKAMAVSGDTLFVAGQADSLAGEPGRYLAALSRSTAARFSWDPRPNQEVVALAVSGSTLYAGGRFNSLGDWVDRHNLAAFDATTGALTAWDPHADDYVRSILVSGRTVYVGGGFSTVGGRARPNLAAVDASTGLATAWNPSPNGIVNSLAFWKNTVLVGGYFTSAGGQPRNSLASIDTASGLATAWNPDANDRVYCVLPADSVIYIGGWFSAVGGQTRLTLAAVDTSVGRPTSWAPATNAVVLALAVQSGVIYVGGSFDQIAGAARSNLAAIDAAGQVMDWTPNPDSDVNALVATDNIIYVGGDFQSIGNRARSCLAALDTRSGTVKEWDPAPGGYAGGGTVVAGYVYGLDVGGGKVYAGGGFGVVGAWPRSGIAAIGPADPPTPAPPQFFVLAPVSPNPLHAEGTVRFTLPSASAVSLTVYDLQGRRVASLLSRAALPAGPHNITLQPAGWPGGVYFCRLDGSGATATRKFVVIR